MSRQVHRRKQHENTTTTDPQELITAMPPSPSIEVSYQDKTLHRSRIYTSTTKNCYGKRQKRTKTALWVRMKKFWWSLTRAPRETGQEDREAKPWTTVDIGLEGCEFESVTKVGTWAMEYRSEFDAKIRSSEGEGAGFNDSARKSREASQERQEVQSDIAMRRGSEDLDTKPITVVEKEWEEHGHEFDAKIGNEQGRGVEFRAHVDSLHLVKAVSISPRLAQTARFGELKPITIEHVYGFHFHGQSGELLWTFQSPKEAKAHGFESIQYYKSTAIIVPGLPFDFLIGPPELERLRIRYSPPSVYSPANGEPLANDHRTPSTSRSPQASRLDDIAMFPGVVGFVPARHVPDRSQETRRRQADQEANLDNMRRQRERDRAANAQRSSGGGQATTITSSIGRVSASTTSRNTNPSNR
ncbi:MAG: hypothetical protein M1820_007887 [Bogoriella megaspora]|nr:MAG: hypothetical protein M1820_007887 [Bogoriella megaspora]